MPTERGFSLFACFFKNHLVSIIPLGKCKLGSVHTVIECSKYRIDRLLYFRCSYIITKFFRCLIQLFLLYSKCNLLCLDIQSSLRSLPP